MSRTKKPKPFARLIFDPKADFRHRIMIGDVLLVELMASSSQATDRLDRINAAAESWHAERCATCEHKKVHDDMQRLRSLFGSSKPKPIPSLAETKAHWAATQEKILSTLNDAERRIIEQRFGIKPATKPATKQARRKP